MKASRDTERSSSGVGCLEGALHMGEGVAAGNKELRNPTQCLQGCENLLELEVTYLSLLLVLVLGIKSLCPVLKSLESSRLGMEYKRVQRVWRWENVQHCGGSRSSNKSGFLMWRNHQDTLKVQGCVLLDDLTFPYMETRKSFSCAVVSHFVFCLILTKENWAGTRSVERKLAESNRQKVQ